MGRNGIFESMVGLVVVIAALAFVWYSWSMADKSVGRDSYTLNAVFGRIDGVSTGADVRIAGVKIGAVAGYSLVTETYQANVRLLIDKGVPVPDDTIAKVVADGLLGGAHIALEPGASEDYLTDGDTVTITQGSVDLLGLAVQSFTNSNGNRDSTGDNVQSGGLEE